MYANLKKFLLIRLAVIAAVLIAAVLVTYQWLQPLVQQALSRHEQVQGDYDAALLVSRELAQVETDYQSTTRERAALYDYLLPQVQTFRVIDQIEKIGRKYNLAYTIDVQNTLTTVGRAPAVPAVINLRGDKNDVIGFLGDLEKLRYPVVEQKLDYEIKYMTAITGEVREGVNATVTVLIGVAPEKY